MYANKGVCWHWVICWCAGREEVGPFLYFIHHSVQDRVTCWTLLENDSVRRVSTAHQNPEFGTRWVAEVWWEFLAGRKASVDIWTVIVILTCLICACVCVGLCGFQWGVGGWGWTLLTQCEAVGLWGSADWLSWLCEPLALEGAAAAECFGALKGVSAHQSYKQRLRWGIWCLVLVDFAHFSKAIWG